MFHFAGFRSLAVIWFALLLILATTGCKHGGGGGARIAAEVTVTGSVVTPAGRPIAGLTVRVVDTQLTASSDSVGRFRIDSVVFGSNGTAAIEFDASTGVPSSTFRMRMPLQRTGQPRLHLSDPIVIPMTQPGFGTRIHAATSQVAGAPAHPGAALTIAKDSVDFAATDGRTTGAPARKGEIQMVYMPRHQLPGPMPGGQVSDVVFSIQPSGIAFDPPAPITFPNYDGFAAGEQVPIMQVDPKTGEWQQVGTATVNQAGTLIVSNPGSGARWGSCTGCCFPPCLGNVVGQVTVRTGAGVAQPLANASVRVSTGHATTDAEGRYRMVGVAVGNCNAGNGPFEQQAVASWEPTEGGQSPLREERTVSLSPDTDNTVDFEFDVLQLSFVDDGNDRQGVVGGTAPTSATITSVVADNERDGGGQRHGTHVQVLPGIAHDIADDAMLTIAIDPSSDPGDRGSLVVDSTLDDGRAGSGALLEERQSVEVAVRDLRSRSKTVRYVAPAVFLPGEIDPADGREVHRVRFSASITQTTAEGTQTFGTREPAELRIVRPQLFFVHGTLSSRGAWTNDGSLTPDLAQLTEEFLAAIEPVVGRGGRDLFEQITADYSAGHQQPVEELASLVLGQLEDHRRDLQRAGIAATRFDLVAHSYGGLIVRDIIHNCAGDPNAAQRVRRLGTLGTPHLGAALADRILNLCDHNVGGARAVLDETVDAVNLNLSSVEAWADFWQGEYGSILRSTTAAQVTAAIEATWASSAFGTSIFTDAAAERRMSSGLVPGRDTRLGPLLTHGLVSHVKYVMGYGTRQPQFDATDGLYALFGFSAGSVESFGDLFISEGSARAGNRHLVNEVLCEGRQHSNLTLIDCIEALVARLQSTGLWGQIPDPVPERRGPVLYWVSHVVLDPAQPYDLSIRGANLFTPIENGLRLRLPVVALSPGCQAPCSAIVG